MRKYYPGITIFKLVGCILVVFSHGMFAHYIINLANQQLRFIGLVLSEIVPCFYVISGFLAYKGWTHAKSSRQYIQNYVKWIAIVYCFFCVLFVIEYIVPQLLHNGLTVGNIILQSKILFMTVFLNGPYIQFWFIPPLVFGVIVSYWFFAKQNLRLGVTTALLGYVLCQFISGTFRGILADNIFMASKYMGYIELFMTRYLGFGFTFVLAGTLIAKYEDKFLRSRVKVFLIPSITLSIIEAIILYTFSNWDEGFKLTFSILPSTLLLFYGVLHIKWSSVKKYHKFINLFSMVTYFGHIVLLTFSLYVFGWHVNHMGTLETVGYLLLILLECFIITSLLIRRRKYLEYKKKVSA